MSPELENITQLSEYFDGMQQQFRNEAPHVGVFVMDLTRPDMITTVNEKTWNLFLAKLSLVLLELNSLFRCETMEPALRALCATNPLVSRVVTDLATDEIASHAQH
jgi:hypothetical protein